MENNQYLKLKKKFPINTLNDNFYKKDYTGKVTKNRGYVIENNITNKTIVDKIALGLSLTARAKTQF
tara:strand:+ start:358 stop:558 length:201 start_codon:yes stop_codon:yes gene_type:complete